MTRIEAWARKDFEEILTREAGEDCDVRRIAELLCRHGKTYARLQEIWCNVEMTERQEKYWQRRESLIERRIRQLCTELGPDFEPIFDGDPRGNTVKVKVPSGRTNDWGKEGICVPTS